jgi:hypothetical protein
VEFSYVPSGILFWRHKSKTDLRQPEEGLPRDDHTWRRKLLGEDPACQGIECQGQLASMLRTLPGVSDF